MVSGLRDDGNLIPQSFSVNEIFWSFLTFDTPFLIP